MRKTPALSLFAVAFALVFSGCSGCGDDPTGGNNDSGVPSDRGTVEDGGGEDGADSGTGPDGEPVDNGGGEDLGTGMDTGLFDSGANPTNPNNDHLDSDCDGLSDAEEFSTIYPDGNKTDPNTPDTDGDGILDGVEAGRTTGITGAACQPAVVDADPTTRTLPTDSDTDNDGILDGAEDANHNGAVDANESNPTSVDSDGDQILDNVEDANRNGIRDPGELNPAYRDSDGDGIPDGVEDANHNGVYEPGPSETNPLDTDTDDDTLLDGVEDSNHDGIAQPYETNPRLLDTDCDGIADGVELANGTSPLSSDSDGDGIADGVERGLTASTDPNCPMVPVDADPTTTTGVDNSDTDGDGLADGVEDANHNGRVDAGETDPNNADSDGDGLPDGDEVRAGYDPTNPNDPGMEVGTGIDLICSDTNLKVVDFNVLAQQWTLSDEQSMTYVPIAVSAAGVGVEVGALDDTVASVSGFVVRMPLIAGTMTAAGQNTAMNARLNAGAAAANLGIVVRTSPRNISSHDGYDTVVSGVLDVSVASGQLEAAEVRNVLLRLATGLTAGDFTALPTNSPGATANAFVFAYQLLLRTNPDQVIVVGALLDRPTFDSATDNASILISDLTNGTALARADARRDKDCDPFVAGQQAVADFLWMADISGSTDDDRGRIVSASNVVFNALGTNGVDFRMGVVRHIENDFTQGAGNGGDLSGVGFTTDPALFAQYLQDTSGTDGCEFGLDAAFRAVNKALPRSAPAVVDALKFRDGAQIAVIYISDEHAQEVTENQCSYDPGGAACDTGVIDYYTTTDNNVCTFVPSAAQQACIDSVVSPYITQLQNNSAIAFAQVISPNATPTTCTGYACPQMGSQATNEPGIGYTEVVNATGGTFYSPCVDNPGNALQSIIDAVTGAASQFQLSGNPISSTIKVGITRVGGSGNGMTDIVPRDKDNGFDYDPVANSIFFRGTAFRPNRDDVVIISYRVWLPPPEPCGGPCDPGMNCDPQLGVCTCDQALCTQNCGPTQVCDATCACACTPDCNGQCGPGQVCNTTSCSCECAPDCGGSCPAGTVCDQNACACVCDSNCGGACEAQPPLECNTAACNCQCPADCGGTCGTGTMCNTSLCACTCPADCTCPGMAACDPNNGCACACPTDCGGVCPDNTACNPTSCACECPADCSTTAGCINRQQCDPNDACNCYCPADCGGCNANETCEVATCRCIPVV